MTRALSFPDPNRRTRRIGALVLLALGVAAIGATCQRVVDARSWRGNTEAARRLAKSSAASPADHREAVVVMLRDARASVEVLRLVAQGDGEASTQARTALAIIAQEACR